MRASAAKQVEEDAERVDRFPGGHTAVVVEAAFGPTEEGAQGAACQTACIVLVYQLPY